MMSKGFHNPIPISYLAFHFKNIIPSNKQLKIKRKFQRYYLGEKYPHVYFTHQEIRCIGYFLLGLNQKQTGKEMGIAVTTVSQNCVSMRKKLGCNSKSELIKTVEKINLKNLYKELIE